MTKETERLGGLVEGDKILASWGQSLPAGAVACGAIAKRGVQIS